MGKMTAENRKKRDEARILAMTPKQEARNEHLKGKHTIGDDNAQAVTMAAVNPNCDFCHRRVGKVKRRTERVQRFFAGQSKK